MNAKDFENHCKNLEGEGQHTVADELRAYVAQQVDATAKTLSLAIRKRKQVEELREALARVEAERDQWQTSYWKQHRITGEAQAQLAEAVGLLLDASDPKGPRIRYAAIKDFLLRYAAMPDMTAEQSAVISQRTREAYVAQVEQQEAREPVLARPEHGASMSEPLTLTIDRYSGALDQLAVIEQQEAQGVQAGDERAAFEGFIRSRYPKTSLERIDRPGAEAHGEYESSTLHVGWIIWQARAALATQPAAGEHVCTLKGRIPHYAIKGSNFLPCYCWSGVDHQIGREVKAPPAAAHGDEAVRKDAERYRWVREPSSGNEMWAMICAGECGRNMDDAIDAAMRAQDDGEVQ